MNNWVKVSLAVAAMGAAQLLHAGDISRGEDLSGDCMACHGADGNSENPEWPKIAGQNERYLVEQLKAYQTGDRENAIMAGEVEDLSEQDIRDLAAFYAAQDPTVESVDPDLKELGESIYRGGIPDKGVAACMACHAADGSGLPGAGFPRLGGQHAEYTAGQLQKYRDGDRATDRNRMMRGVAEKMSDEEIEAVSSYISGLYRDEEDR